jgi:hypothetical protein
MAEFAKVRRAYAQARSLRRRATAESLRLWGVDVVDKDPEGAIRAFPEAVKPEHYAKSEGLRRRLPSS